MCSLRVSTQISKCVSSFQVSDVSLPSNSFKSVSSLSIFQMSLFSVFQTCLFLLSFKHVSSFCLSNVSHLESTFRFASIPRTLLDRSLHRKDCVEWLSFQRKEMNGCPLNARTFRSFIPVELSPMFFFPMFFFPMFYFVSESTHINKRISGMKKQQKNS